MLKFRQEAKAAITPTATKAVYVITHLSAKFDATSILQPELVWLEELQSSPLANELSQDDTRV